MKRIAVIDYGSGNLRSAAKALEAVAGADEHVIVTAEAREIETAARIVLPGVGAFADCYRGLAALPGMMAALDKRARRDGVAFLGICVGMQLLATEGHEHGVHPGLGWIGGTVEKLTPPPGGKIPHMGWNELRLTGETPSPAKTKDLLKQIQVFASSPQGGEGAPVHPLFKGINDGAHVYFVHSYHVVPADSGAVLATVDYGQPVAAAVGQGNILGVQFHPEKSQETGLKILRNFLDWQP
ncbi:MAG: imidazole glycerol phosphate synthase subunit HisH [Alphaproteobacteria bacterium]